MSPERVARAARIFDAARKGNCRVDEIPVGLGLVVVGEDAYGRRVEVVELARANRPNEDDGDRDGDEDRDPDEHRKDVHRRQPPGGCARERRKAFPATASELNDMPIAAAQGGTAPEAASGSAMRL